MSSKRSHEGYLQIDHRESPGLPAGMAHASGLPVGAGTGMFEAATITCAHCCRVMIRNPLRTRDRAWCSKCDKYLCDWCGAAMAKSGDCRSIERIVDELQAAAARGATEPELNSIIITP